MEDARRFLRYVMPGLTFAVQVLFFIWIIDRKSAKDILDYLNSDKGVGLVLAALLASGGLGYIFSIVHHTIHRWYGSVNHSTLLNRLQAEKILFLKNIQDGKDISESTIISRHDAWSIAASLWHERLVSNKIIKSAEKRTSTLTDLVHSTGTARIASMFALITALWVAYEKAGDSMNFISQPKSRIMLAIAAGLLILHECAYRNTGRSAERVIDQALYDALVLEKDLKSTATSYVILSNPWWRRLLGRFKKRKLDSESASKQQVDKKK